MSLLCLTGCGLPPESNLAKTAPEPSQYPERLQYTVTLTPYQPVGQTIRKTPISSTQEPSLSSGTSAITASPFPEDGSPAVIGTSVEGKPLEMHRFGNGPQGKLIIAGIHGGYEWNTVLLANKLIEFLKEDPSLIPDQQTLYILPILNIDGALREHGPAGRSNAHNVDLNRNWDANWKAVWNPSLCWDALPITAGTGPGSEPETQALMDFILTHPLVAVLSYHSAGADISAGGQPADVQSKSLAQDISAASGYQYPSRNPYCEYTGQFIDWASIHHIPAVDVELPDHSDIDWKTNLRVLRAFLAWEPEQP